MKEGTNSLFSWLLVDADEFLRVHVCVMWLTVADSLPMQKGCSLLPHRLFWMDNFVIVKNVHVTFLLLSWAGLSWAQVETNLESDRPRASGSIYKLKDGVVFSHSYLPSLNGRPVREARVRGKPPRFQFVSVDPGLIFIFAAVAQNHGRSGVLLCRLNAIMDFRVPFSKSSCCSLSWSKWK